MFISTRADDAKKVFVNGKFVAEASNKEKLTDFPLAKYAQPGSNVVEISYELFGAPNFGENVGELKGSGIGRHRRGFRLRPKAWKVGKSSASAALMRGREDQVPTRVGAGMAWTPASFLGGGEKPAPGGRLHLVPGEIHLPAA